MQHPPTDPFYASAASGIATLAVSMSNTVLTRLGADGRPRLVLQPIAAIRDCVFVRVGVDHSGRPCYAVRVESLPSAPASGVIGVRTIELVGRLDPHDRRLLLSAIAWLDWHGRHRYCARCGGRTRPVEHGHRRFCPTDNSYDTPRLDPAVIMAVLDPAGRVLLARRAGSPVHRFSVLAGYVEAGETLEAAVVREAREEAGADVATLEYVGSQSWPFSNSVMFGYYATARSDALSVDSAELAEARWFTRTELARALSSGTVALPDTGTIAWSLIAGWFGGPLPGIRWHSEP